MVGRWNGHPILPPPFYNFAVIPPITSHEVFWDMKKQGWQPDKNYQDIECFRNTGMGLYLSGFAFLMAFGIVWQIIWLIAIGLIGAIACMITLSFDDELEYVLPAAEVAKIEKSYVRG